MRFIDKMINLGIVDSLKESEKRGIKVFNAISFLFIGLLLLMVANVTILGFSVLDRFIAFFEC